MRWILVFLSGLMAMSAALAGTEPGLLWKVESPQGTTSYLFGTIHADDPRVTGFSPEVVQALERSDVFMMETLPPDDMSMLFIRKGTLSDLLKPEEMQQVFQLADQHAMRDDFVNRMKPWLLASIFSLPKPMSPLFQDVLLYNMARESNKQLLGLEDTKEHFAALDSLSQADQLALLRAILSETQQQKEQAYEETLQAYMSRNTEKLIDIDEKWSSIQLPAELWDRVRSKILDQRNERMAARIVQQAADTTVFIAVGASHLAGKDGLVGRLRASGYKMTPLQ
jgi:uncharacterized protein